MIRTIRLLGIPILSIETEDDDDPGDPGDPGDCTTTPVGFTHVDPHWQPSPTPSTETNREDS